MELEIIEEKKNRLVFKIPGVSHGFCMMLKDQLQQDDSVKIATYKVEHPLVNVPQFLVETDAGSDAKKAVLDAVKKLKAFSEKSKKDFEKALK